MKGGGRWKRLRVYSFARCSLARDVQRIVFFTRAGLIFLTLALRVAAYPMHMQCYLNLAQERLADYLNGKICPMHGAANFNKQTKWGKGGRHVCEYEPPPLPLPTRLAPATFHCKHLRQLWTTPQPLT